MSLISPDELLARLGDPALRICDVRWWLADPGKGRRDYATGHLPGAVFVDLDTDLAAPEGPGRHPLPSPAAFAGRMAALGIGDGHEVVAYDDASGTIAARLWFRGGWTRTIDREGLAARLGSVSLIDARAPERYRGDIEPVDAVPGHIPTAISLPTAGNLGPDGRFLDPQVLRARFDTLGPEVVTSCGSGVTACHNALAMRVSGLPDPILYPGSYSDWAGTGMPIATGDEPGTTER